MDAIDPVLLRLQRWALERGLTREAVAQRLGVSRTAVAGWFIGLEAQQAGRGMPSSARGFRYGAQRPPVQHAIAEVLDSSRESLQAESLTVVGASTSPGVAVPAVVGELEQAARSVIGDLAVGVDVTLLDETASSVARLVDRHPEVRAVAVIKEARGPIDSFQHQVAVLVGSRLRDDAVARGQLRDELTVMLQGAGLPAKWEHGSLVPGVRLRDNDGDELHLLGSIIAPSTLAARAPRTGLLIPRVGGTSPAGRQLRVAAVLGDPYTGNDVLAAVLAQALGAGFVSTGQLRRAVLSRRARSLGGPEQSRAERLDAVTESDSSFVLHKGFHVIAAGRVPGAWVVPIPVRQFLPYEPLRAELIDLDGLVVTVRLGPAWQRFAAWRLAAIDLNSARLATEETALASSDQLELADGAPISSAARRVLDEQHERSLHWLRELRARDERLAAFIEERAARDGADLLSLTHDVLPEDLDCLAVVGDTARSVDPAGELPERCVFPDRMSGATALWVESAAEVLERLRQRTGADVDAYVAGLNAGAAADAYRSRFVTT